MLVTVSRHHIYSCSMSLVFKHGCEVDGPRSLVNNESAKLGNKCMYPSQLYYHNEQKVTHCNIKN